MTGLSVLYATEATEEREWELIPDRDRTGRLREVYWARCVESKSRRKQFVSFRLNWRADRSEIGRHRYDPGDGFIYLVEMMPKVEERFEWLEVTEVFTNVAASQIESAMRAWNCIPYKHSVDFDAFVKAVPLGRPSRVAQRRAADQVIRQIERKLAKASYKALLEKYGYGTLVVGMPLWFAVPPNDPFRSENALDDFMTRTGLGLEDVKRRVLKKRDCPFRNVVVIWDTTPQAWREWRSKRSAEYADAVNASLENPFGVSTWAALSDTVEEAVCDTKIPESEAPSMSLHLDVKTRKKTSGNGPYPRFVQAFGRVVSKPKNKVIPLRTMLKLKVTVTLFKLFCFLRIHGLDGLKRRIARKLSLPYAWRVREARSRARRFYQESRRRGRDFGRTSDIDGVGGR